MKSILLVQDSLKWAFHKFADNLPIFLKLVLISTAITLLSTVLTLGLALIVVPFYVTLCFINIALMLYDGKKLDNIQQCTVGWKKFLKSFAALWVYSIAVLGGLILFVIPGIYIASRYYYVIYCIMSDDTGIIESFQCSNHLTEKMPWHGFLLLCCATILGSVWFLLPVAALMNVYAYKYCKTNTHLKA
jgi:hypothetical protein